MQYVKQDDYDNFKCIAGKCPKSCCEGWQICIDDEALEEYENIEGSFKSRIRNSIDFNEGTFLQHDRRCAMLNNEGLCDLQIELGESALCYTCKMYPRHVEEYENIRELSLSLSCPEVARMIVEKKERFSLAMSETDEEDDFEDFDYFLFSKLEDTRDLFFKIIYSEKGSLINKLNAIFKISMEIQKEIDKDSFFNIDNHIENWDSNIDKFLGNDEDNNKELIVNKSLLKLYELEMLEENWTNIVDEAYFFMKDKSVEEIIDCLSKDEKFIFENLLFSYFYIYLYGSVYDYNVFSKSGLCIYSVIWIFEIYLKRKSENKIENCEDTNKNILIKVIYEFARQVEHSDINLDLIEEYFTL